jgi:hypothetical protein
MDELRSLLAKLEIPAEGLSVFGIWRGRTEGGLRVHLSPAAFWRAVKRIGAEVRSEERSDLLFRFCHRFSLERVEFFTFSAEPILQPGTVTPGYALRLT